MIQCQYVIDIFFLKTVSFIFTLIIRHRTSICIYIGIQIRHCSKLFKGKNKNWGGWDQSWKNYLTVTRCRSMLSSHQVRCHFNNRTFYVGPVRHRKTCKQKKNGKNLKIWGSDWGPFPCIPLPHILFQQFLPSYRYWLFLVLSYVS